MASAETDTSRRASRSTCNDYEAVRARHKLALWTAELVHLAGEEAARQCFDEALGRLRKLEQERKNGL